jgi:hypothetical protein
MKYPIFWDETPFSSVEVHHEKKTFACHLLSPGYYLGILINPEHGGSTFLCNVCAHLSDYKTSHPEKQNSDF